MTEEMSPQQETAIVRNYLAILRAIRNGEIKPMRAAAQRLQAIEDRLKAGVVDPIDELKLVQEHADIRQHLALFEVEQQFIKVVYRYSERHGITYSTWREMGVEPNILGEGRVPNKGGQLQLALPAGGGEKKKREGDRRGGRRKAVWDVDKAWPYFEQRLQRGPIERTVDQPILRQLVEMFADSPDEMSEKNVMNYLGRFETLGKLVVERGAGKNASGGTMPHVILRISLPPVALAPATEPEPRTKQRGRSRAA